MFYIPPLFSVDDDLPPPFPPENHVLPRKNPLISLSPPSTGGK